MPNFPQRGAVQEVDTIALLQAIPDPDMLNRTFYVRGRTTVGDGGQGEFRWVSGDATAVNLGTVFAHNTVSGRFIRQFSGAINVKWFGAKGDGVTNDEVAITSAANAARASGNSLDFPCTGETYVVSGTLDLRDINQITMVRESSIESTVSGVAVRAGGDSKLLTGADLTIFVDRSIDDWTAGNIGVLINRLRAARVRLASRGFQIGIQLHTDAAGYYIVHSDFHIEELKVNSINARIESSGSGSYIVANRFHGGNWILNQLDGVLPEANVKLVTSGDGIIQDNRWIAPALGAVSGTTDSGAIAWLSVNHASSGQCRNNDATSARIELGSSGLHELIKVFDLAGNETKHVLSYAFLEPTTIKVTIENPLDPHTVELRDELTRGSSPISAGALPTPFIDGSGTAQSRFPGRLIFDCSTLALDADSKIGGTAAHGDGSARLAGATQIVGQYYTKPTGASSFYRVNSKDMAVICYNSSGTRLTGTAPYYAMTRQFREQSVGGNLIYQGRGTWLWLHPDVAKVFIGQTVWNSSDRTFVDFNLEHLAGNLLTLQPILNSQVVSDNQPVNTIFPLGAQVHGTSANGWRVTSRRDTTLTAAASSTDLTITVASISGINSGDVIGIQLDSSTNSYRNWHWTTVNGAPAGTTITLTDAIPGAAAIGNSVFSNRWVTK